MGAVTQPELPRDTVWLPWCCLWTGRVAWVSPARTRGCWFTDDGTGLRPTASQSSLERVAV